MAKNGCYECTERTINCHSTCEKYKKYKEELEKIAKVKRYEKLGTNNSWSFIPRRIREGKFKKDDK